MNPLLTPSGVLALLAVTELLTGDPVTAFRWGMPAAAVALLAVDRSRRERLAREDATLPGAQLL